MENHHIYIPPSSTNNTIFIKAKQTGERQFLGRYNELCNDVTEDCNLDHIYIYVLPSGEFEEIRIHTWIKEEVE
jgi:hypothetical protein